MLPKRADEQYMKRALQLARRGMGQVSPNPMVGAVIVRSDKIIAEGYHRRFGGDHAERYALKRASSRVPMPFFRSSVRPTKIRSVSFSTFSTGWKRSVSVPL